MPAGSCWLICAYSLVTNVCAPLRIQTWQRRSKTQGLEWQELVQELENPRRKTALRPDAGRTAAATAATDIAASVHPTHHPVLCCVQRLLDCAATTPFWHIIVVPGDKVACMRPGETQRWGVVAPEQLPRWVAYALHCFALLSCSPAFLI